MPSADGTSVLGAGELIDLFECPFDRLVRQQLVEVDGYPIAIPFRGGRKSNRNSVGDGTEHEGLAITRRQRLLLASQKPVLDFRSDLHQERLLVRQPHQQPEFFPKALTPQTKTGIEQRVAAHALCGVERMGGPQASENRFGFHKTPHSLREIREPSAYLMGIRASD